MRAHSRPRVVAPALALAIALSMTVLPSTAAEAAPAAPSNYQVTSIEVGPNAQHVAVNETTNTIYVSTRDDTAALAVIDGATASVTSVIPMPTGAGDVAVNETTNRVYVISGNNTITVIDGATATVISAIAVGYGPSALAVDEANDILYVANFSSGSLSVIDGATGTVTGTVAVGEFPNGLALNSTTSTLYVTNLLANTVTVVDTAAATVTATIAVESEPTFIAVNETTNSLYLTNLHDFSVSVIDGSTNTIVASIPTGQGSYPQGIAYDETTDSIYVVNSNYGAMLRIDGATNTVTSSTRIGSRTAYGIAVNTTTQRMYVPRAFDATSIAVITARSDSRLAGTDRFATSAAISAANFEPGVSVAYIANGLSFPDALSGAAAAGAMGAPVLLVTPSAIPAAIQAELTRLHPARIVVLGGTAVVSNVVKSQLASFTAGAVTRIAGTDRFSTSAAISAATFAPGVPVAYIANGFSFPDALSGAAAAGASGAPVLLVSPTAIPAAIQAELARLNPARIVVLGGTGVVSDAAKSRLASYTSGAVTRIAGADRFATSAAISAATFGSDVPVVYIANGLSFPDALSGAAVAGANGAPVLLVTPTSINGIGAELERLNPRTIVVLGGEGAVPVSIIEGLYSLL